MASVLQAQIADNLEQLDNPDIRIDTDFNLVTDTSSFDGSGPDDCLLEHETGDNEMLNLIRSNKVPSVCSLFR